MTLTKEQVIKKLRGYIYAEYCTAAAYADSKGVSRSYVSTVLAGQKSIPSYMLDDIGVVRDAYRLKD